MPLKTTKMILGTLLVTCFLITALPTTIMGEEGPRVIPIENKCGLEVEIPQKTVDLGNLNPGERKESYIKVTNKGSGNMTLFIRTNMMDETTVNGGYLADAMKLTIKDGRNMIADDLFRNVVDNGSIFIGTLAPGTSKILDLSTYLPGDETGNEYQGAYMKVSWTFVTQCSSSGDGEERDDSGGGTGGGAGAGNTTTPPGEIVVPPEEILIEDERVPMGSDELVEPDEANTPHEPIEPGESEITIEDDKMPYGYLTIPKTGQMASMYFYSLGTLIMMIGLQLKKK